MDYFKILNLNKEPFSNSPDPDFFFHSRQHLDCLQKLELSLLLRRGLNVIIGDVGTGKTTLCRQLIRRFSQKKEVETHLILDPHVLNASEFLATVTEMFTGKKPPVGSHEWQIKEQIKRYLFHKGVDNNKTVVLIIDEGQKIPTFCLEILREFLNFETNEYKLLQIVIFAQKEFEGTIRKYPNFADRINLYHSLKPLSFRDTRLMIKYRLEKSSNSQKKMRLFTLPALWSIYRITAGYPRRIINLCHQSILSMIIQNRSKSGYFLVKTCARRVFPEETRRRRLFRIAAMTAGAVVVALLIFLPSGGFKSFQIQGIQGLKNIFSDRSHPEARLPVAESKPPAFSAQIAPPEFGNPQRSETEKTEIPETTATLPSETPFTEETAAVAENPVKEAAPKTIEETVPDKPPAQPPEAPEEKSAAPLVAAIPEERQPETVSAEKPNPDLPDADSSTPTYSTILGQITLKRNETLSRIIKGVYGGFNSKYFKSFITANPDIEDPDRVDVGQIISLPAIPTRVTPKPTPVWWVRIDDRDTLEAAFNILRDQPDHSPGIRLIPYWNPSDGTRFAVVLNKLFKDEPTARQHLQQLPLELASNSTILSRWDKRTVYFANPYFN
jgi:general secretion pathway protein A